MQSTTNSTVSGTLISNGKFYPSQIQSPSKITIQLLDVSLQDAPSTTIAQQIILLSGKQPRKLPIPFKIVYDPTKIGEMNTYSVSVSVKTVEGDKLIWTSTFHNPVLTRGAPKAGVKIWLEMVRPFLGGERGEQAASDMRVLRR